MQPDLPSRSLPAGASPAAARLASPTERLPVSRVFPVDAAGAQVPTTALTCATSLRRLVMAMGGRLRHIAEGAARALERAERRITDGFRVPPGGG